MTQLANTSLTPSMPPLPAEPPAWDEPDEVQTGAMGSLMVAVN